VGWACQKQFEADLFSQPLVRGSGPEVPTLYRIALFAAGLIVPCSPEIFYSHFAVVPEFLDDGGSVHIKIPQFP
jgi:hypothetical protein